MTSRNAYMTSRFSVPASAGPLLPLVRHDDRCPGRTASRQRRTRRQAGYRRGATDLPFLSSVVGSPPLVLQLLPERLHESVGSDDTLFLAVVCEWQIRRAPAPPMNAAAQKAWHAPLVKALVERLM